jgi:uncharacterized protein YdeI (YjbR/CyaY-like superfamily)
MLRSCGSAFPKRVPAGPASRGRSRWTRRFAWAGFDGIRKSVDDDSYKIRFTPRRQGSVWSVINIKRCQTLADEGRVLPAGLKAFEARKENKSGIYAYEQRRDQLEEPYASKFRKNKSAWAFFQAQPPSYRKKVGWWIISAKQEATRLKRLQKGMELSARRERA